MSIRLMTAAWDCDLSGNDKLVLLALADWANDDGHCWPSIAKLCAKTCASERTVQGIIKRLVEALHLTRQELPGRGCNYLVHPRNDCTPADSAPPQKWAETPAEVAGNTSRNTNTPLTPLAAKPPQRRKRDRDPSTPPEPLSFPVGMEGHEATEFRKQALAALGDGAYRNLIAPCHVARTGDGLLLQAPSQTLCEIIRARWAALNPIARTVGCTSLRVEAKPAGKHSATDPKVVDAMRQLEAIRGGRATGVSHQTGRPR